MLEDHVHRVAMTENFDKSSTGGGARTYARCCVV